MDKPKEFWNLLKLQEVFRSDRLPSLREILQVIFGLQPGVASREQLASEHFERYLATQPIDATKVREVRQVFHAIVLDGVLRGLIEKGAYAELRAQAGLHQAIKTLGPEGIKALSDYISRSVPIGDFVKVA